MNKPRIERTPETDDTQEGAPAPALPGARLWTLRLMVLARLEAERALQSQTERGA